MGSQTVRDAIQAFLAPPNIPGLATVYRGLPVSLKGEDWPIGQDTGWGAGSYIQLNDMRETRVALGGEHGGMKKRVYECALVVFFRWQYTDHGPYNQTDGWTTALDGLTDAILERMRGDRTFGCDDLGPVWQGGEGDGDGSDDLRFVADGAQVDEDSGQVVVWAAVEFTVVEMLTAT